MGRESSSSRLPRLFCPGYEGLVSKLSSVLARPRVVVKGLSESPEQKWDFEIQLIVPILWCPTKSQFY